jgi:hypothetical protein
MIMGAEGRPVERYSGRRTAWDGRCVGIKRISTGTSVTAIGSSPGTPVAVPRPWSGPSKTCGLNAGHQGRLGGSTPCLRGLAHRHLFSGDKPATTPQITDPAPERPAPIEWPTRPRSAPRSRQRIAGDSGLNRTSNRFVLLFSSVREYCKIEYRDGSTECTPASQAGRVDATEPLPRRAARPGPMR